ncbi:MAG: gamma-glutamyltransferase [Nitrospinota bacterium]
MTRGEVNEPKARRVLRTSEAPAFCREGDMGRHYLTGRSVVYAKNGMVATSQTYATLAGLDILREGGNAIDAAVAAAAVQHVVEPHNTGIGGDMFALFWWARTGDLKGLNASGRAPGAATIEELRRRGHRQMPIEHVHAITTPGALDGWATLMESYGRMDLSRVLAPAIRLAEEGFVVSPVVSREWEASAEKLSRDQDAARHYLLAGRAPRAGETFRNPALAQTLRTVVEGGKGVLYQGELGEKVVRAVREKDGLLAMEDLASHRSDWVEPIQATFHGYQVFELPPNGQGITALIALNILEEFDLPALGHNSADYCHLVLEAIKLAFADRNYHVTDPQAETVPTERLLSKAYAAERRKLIDSRRALPEVSPGRVASGDTVYLATADAEGNMVSFINSLYFHFGSGVCAGETGLLMQNRGTGFVLDENHPNRLQPHKRPLHTLIPAFLMKDGTPLMAFGVMGGDMQPQGHIQFLLNHLVFGMDIQEAVEAPRFRFVGGNEVWLEDRIPAAIAEDLARRGHQAYYRVDSIGFGGAQIIARDPETGVYSGASESRKDGCALGY